MNHPALSASLDHDACGVGFIAQLGGEATRDVVQRALVALARLSHRGGVDSDGLSGDGAGLLLPIPRVFFRAQSLLSGISLPETFGLGMTFLPPGRETEARRDRVACAANRFALSGLARRACQMYDTRFACRCDDALDPSVFL